MKKYNYFDDDPLELEPVKKTNEQNKKAKLKINFDVKSLAGKAMESVDEFIHGDALKDIREINKLPNLRNRLLKLLAFVLFVLAIVISIFLFKHAVTVQTEKNNKFNNDAGKVCIDYITEFGTAKWEYLDSETYGKNMARLTGLCYARQMDFNDDGDDELMICYNNRNVYYLEVWGYIDKEFSKIYSEEANKTNDTKDGSWVGFYHKNNKYYICKSSADKPEKVDLYVLKGDKFKKASQCDYDYKNDIYSVKGKINAEDFETIKLSVIKYTKADSVTDIVTANIDGFTDISAVLLENKKTDAQLKAEAYYEIIKTRNSKYGTAEIKNEKGDSYLSGLAVVELVDFDMDDNEELLLVYRKMLKESSTDYYTGNFIIIEEPTYCIEVYNWNGTVAKKIFSKDFISNYMDDSSTNYIMLKHNKKSVDICSNYYDFENSYSYSAYSRIYRLKKGQFDTIFNVKMEDDYGYRNYYIDGEYSYQSSFNEKAYQVPKYLNDNEKVDNQVYKITYLSGNKNKNSFKSTVDSTVKTIKSINANYSTDDN